MGQEQSGLCTPCAAPHVCISDADAWHVLLTPSSPARRMKEDAAAKNLPPVYRGKWASASAEEVQAAKDAGLDYTYRFRVPKVRCTCADGRSVEPASSLSQVSVLQSSGLSRLVGLSEQMSLYCRART